MSVKLLIRTIVILSLSCIAAVFLIPMFDSSKPNMSRALTRDEIHECYVAILILEKNEHKSLEDMLGTQTSAGSLNQNFVLLLQHNNLLPNPIGKWKTQLVSSELVDAWRHPLQIKRREDLVDSQYDFLKTNINQSIIIWSVGANGTNEFGAGDDVIFPISAEMRNSWEKSEKMNTTNQAP